ncbi:MAG: hypothetical protein UU48_C0006G0093 [Candidatus Uhrbacteria bacterium GW2011_GWF2_41_16]|uniref:Uncharacterized protein n=2 Tax=Candidatus Uhriibacteriota TaxID=1752732 RepID=A0A0G0VAP9_9BACT|nr:MAG: hypothetical protein UU35_C0007G0039 [Candidatus Uhrbacteria bacterium GW2011_GWC2_41_11]KKR98053.1 MAG: hypothetical protein UU48_C0006G0093 [Candidatus Uhrbacteria bacterium GW2011_GWF2_41_16]
MLFYWSHFRDSNPGPLLYESIALPTELKWQETDDRDRIKMKTGDQADLSRLLPFKKSRHLR